MRRRLSLDVADAFVGDRGVGNGVRYRAMAHKRLQRPARGVDTRAAMDGTIVQKDLKIRIILIRITDARRRDCIRFVVPSRGWSEVRGHAMQYDDLWFAISTAWVLVLLGATILAIFA